MTLAGESSASAIQAMLSTCEAARIASGRSGRNCAVAAAVPAGFRDHRHHVFAVEALRVERRQQIHPHGQHVHFIQRVPRQQRMTAVEARALAVLHHGNLRLGFLHRRARRGCLQQAKYRPSRTGVGHQAHVAPGQGDAVAAIHRAQVPGRVCVEEMPMTIGRHGGHAAHDQRRGDPQLAAAGDTVRLANQETAKWNARAKQRSGKKTAFEIAPRMQHVLRTHAGGGTCGFTVARVNCAVRRDGAVAVMQDFVADDERQLILQPFLLIAQPLVDQHSAGCLELRAHQSPARLAGIAVEPSHVERMLLADGHHRIQGQRHLAFAAFFRRAFDVGEIVVTRFLPDSDQQLRKLPPRSAGLREQLGQRVLQQFVREQERRLQGHGFQASPLALCRCGFDLGVLIEKPAHVLAEYAGQHLQHIGRGHALTGLHHAQIGHRGSRCRIDLHAPRRQFIQRESIALAQRPQLGPEKMSLPDQSCHGALL